MSAFVGLWAGLHVQVAKLTQCPEIAISQDDSKAFLSAVQNVARHYPIGATQKAMDWGALIITTGLIYSPRYLAIQKRLHTPPPQMGQAGAPPMATVYSFESRTLDVEVPPPPPDLGGMH